MMMMMLCIRYINCQVAYTPLEGKSLCYRLKIKYKVNVVLRMNYVKSNIWSKEKLQENSSTQKLSNIQCVILATAVNILT